MKSVNACPVPAIRWVSWAAVFAALLGFHQNVVAETAWSPPIVVYQTPGVATGPALVADSQGDVHLVFVYRESNDPKAGKPNAIMYVRWHEGSWSRPVDVLVSPSGGTDNFPAIALDKQGYLHVVWEGGAAGQVYYSRAHVSLASSARNWSPPRILSKEGSLRSSIEATPDGLLHFVYASSQGNVFYRQSKDGGQT